MELNSASTAFARASKRMRHAARMLADAQTERARSRHVRRLRNAQRALGEARYDFEAMAFESAD